MAPFTVPTATRKEPNIQPALSTYVVALVPAGSGTNFNPRVTTGLASREYLDKMLAEPV